MLWNNDKLFDVSFKVNIIEKAIAETKKTV